MNQQSVTIQEPVKTPGYAWVVLFATYLASLAAPLNLYKVPPMLTTLAPIFDLSPTAQGNLMSVFSIMGFVLAIPAGFILKRLGIKATVLCAVGALAIGTGLGAISETVTLLFIGRFIEGTGMGLIMVAAPLAVSLWFPADKRAFPMGLWASCIGVGNVIVLVLGPIIAAPDQADQAYNWQSVWWFCSIFAAVAFVVFAVFFRMPKPDEAAEAPQQTGPEDEVEASPSLIKAMANLNVWLLSLAFLTFNLVIAALILFYPTFLENTYQFSKESASSTTSLLMLIAIFSAPLGSYVSDRLKSRKLVIVIPFIVIAIMFSFPFSIGGWTVAAYMIVLGIFMGPVSPVILAAVPETMRSPLTIGIGMGVAALGQNLGMYIGPILFGKVLEMTSFNWAVSGYVMIPICVIGIVAASVTKVR